MDIVFNLRGHTYYIDTAVVTPFPLTQDSSRQPAPAQATGLSCNLFPPRQDWRLRSVDHCGFPDTLAPSCLADSSL